MCNRTALQTGQRTTAGSRVEWTGMSNNGSACVQLTRLFREEIPMTTILDQTQDLSGTETHRLTSIYSPPDFVKSASYAQLCGDPEQMLPHLYADPAARLYPCHSAAATWMSALFFMDKRAAFDDAYADRVTNRLAQAARYFHIEQPVSALVEKMAADIADGTLRLADEDFMLVWEGNGYKERHYPLRNAQEVKVASAWFARYRDEFAFADRQRMAARLLEKAASYGVSVAEDESLHRTAGYGHCAAKDIAAMLEKRATLTQRSHPALSQGLRELARLVEEAPPQARDQGIRIKIAAIVDDFDRETHLIRNYGDGGLERPEDVLFQVTEKQATDFANQHVALANGTVYEKAALQALSLDTVREWMGDELAAAVETGGLFVDHEKLATILATLPIPDATMFDRMADAVGVFPYARDKAAVEQGLTADDMQAMADFYKMAYAPTGQPDVQ